MFDRRAIEGFGVSALGYGVLAPVALASLVPEPSSWLLMIAGFGMVGATARYRRRATKIAYA
ncbi:PEPxxWA-CTERM sorting domain-containing protein [Sphingomonas sp. CFBP 8760]|uniref:PEPxxWA-CTERM sorting domain-containing protein n=1 Tax=Sphingomonas sp. CFBP 8760 TaxID=2775282 RepID=UPI003144EE93